MSNLLRRLSVNLERQLGSGNDSGRESHSFKGCPSFNDFSLHASDDLEDHSHDYDRYQTQHKEEITGRRSFETKPVPVIIGSAPAGPPPILTKALNIPRSSVAHFLSQSSTRPSLDSGGTPRSSLDATFASGSTSYLPTPRASLSEDIPETPRSPTSPTSPTSPSGRRKAKSQKIDGLDYYEFCELIRSSSL